MGGEVGGRVTEGVGEFGVGWRVRGGGYFGVGERDDESVNPNFMTDTFFTGRASRVEKCKQMSS